MSTHVQGFPTARLLTHFILRATLSSVRRVLLVLCLFPLFSCFLRRKFLPMPETPITMPGGGYGVVSTPYLRLTSEMGNLGQQVATLRVGDVVKILQVRMLNDPSRGIWIDHYYIVTENNISGWTSSEFIEQFKFKKTAQEYRKALQSKRANTVSD